MTRTLILVAATALILTACGKQGTLERPGPMGQPTSGPNRDPATDSRSPREAPIPGAPNDPGGGYQRSQTTR